MRIYIISRERFSFLFSAVRERLYIAIGVKEWLTAWPNLLCRNR